MTAKGFEYNLIHKIYDLLELLESCIAFKRFLLVVVYGRNKTLLESQNFVLLGIHPFAHLFRS